MHFYKMVLVVFVGITLSGCALVKHTEKDAAFSVGSVPMSNVELKKKWTEYLSSMPNQVSANLSTKKEYLGFVANESQHRCSDFIASLTIASNTANTSLDMATTVFSALGTAFSPLSTVHVMTAGSSITSGWKTAIDSDIYAKLAIQNLVQAIHSTYGKDIGNYVNALPDVDEDKLIVGAELTKIHTIDQECTLASAEGSIAASLKPTTKGSTTPQDTYLTVNVAGAAGASVPDTLTLNAQSPTIPNIPPVQVKIAHNETAAAIAGALLLKAQPTLKSNSITVTAESPTVIVLSAPSSDAIKWTPSLANGAASGVSITVTTPSNNTQAGQPGEAVSQ